MTPRVEAPKTFSAEQRWFRYLTIFSAARKASALKCAVSELIRLIFSESALFRTENFNSEQRCFREN